jgi:hypothetical protein
MEVAMGHKHIKQLDEAGLAKVKSLESKLGSCIVALEAPTKLADISAEQLQQLKAAEKELGAILLAHSC